MPSLPVVIQLAATKSETVVAVIFCAFLFTLNGAVIFAFAMLFPVSSLTSVTEDNQGNLYVRMNLPDSDTLYSYLFSFADSVEIVEPENIRDQVRKKLAAMQKKYVT